MRFAPVLALLLASSPALADEAEPLPEVDVDFTPDVAGASADLAMIATSGTDTQQLTAGATIEGNAEWHYWRSYAFTRGQATAAAYGASDGAGVTFAQDAEVRPYVSPFLQLTFADRLAFDVAPKLSDRPDRWRRRYRAAGFDVDLVGAQWIGKHVGVQAFIVDNGFDFEEQQDGGDRVERFVNTADWSPIAVTYRKDDEELGKLDPIALEATAIDGAYDGVVMANLTRLSNLQVGPVWVDAAYGRAATGWQTISVNEEVVSTITSAELPVISTPAWRARVGVHGDVEASAGVERNLHLTADAALVLEERASADVATTFRDVTVAATGFAARSRIWTSPDDARDYATGGGSLQIDAPVRRQWTFTGKAELARTFYASVEGDRGLRVDTALRVDLGLRRELRNWVPRGKR